MLQGHSGYNINEYSMTSFWLNSHFRVGFQTCKCLCKVIKVKMHMYLELTGKIRSITINLLYSLVVKTSLSRSLLESVKKSVNSLSISA